MLFWSDEQPVVFKITMCLLDTSHILTREKTTNQLLLVYNQSGMPERSECTNTWNPVTCAESADTRIMLHIISCLLICLKLYIHSYMLHSILC